MIRPQKGFTTAARSMAIVCVVMLGIAAVPSSTVVYDDEDDDYHVHVVINGYWGVYYSGDPEHHYSLYIEASEGVIWGRWMSGGAEEIEGTVDGSFISFYWSTGDAIVTHTGTIDGDAMQGTWADTDNNSGTWSAVKNP